MSSFNAIDLSTLPKPDVIETLDYEVLFAQRKAEFNALSPLLLDDNLQAVVLPAQLLQEPDGTLFYKVPVNSDAGLFYLNLESDPITRILQADVYRELLLRQYVNDSAHAVMIAYAVGTDLDNIAARYGVKRLLITAAVDTTPAVYESDEAFRRRTLLSIEGLSTAGPEGAYIYHALTADGLVKDAAVDHVTFHVNSGAIVIDHDAHLITPEPGMVVVTVLSNTGNGVADNVLLDSVNSALNSEQVRPLTDRVTVRSAEIIEYDLVANITFQEGPSHIPVLELIASKWAEFAKKSHAIGFDIEDSAVKAALHQSGVWKVEIVSPSLPLALENYQAAYCLSVTLNDVGNHVI